MTSDQQEMWPTLRTWAYGSFLGLGPIRIRAKPYSISAFEMMASRLVLQLPQVDYNLCQQLIGDVATVLDGTRRGGWIRAESVAWASQTLPPEIHSAIAAHGHGVVPAIHAEVVHQRATSLANSLRELGLEVEIERVDYDDDTVCHFVEFARRKKDIPRRADSDFTLSRKLGYGLLDTLTWMLSLKLRDF